MSPLARQPLGPATLNTLDTPAEVKKHDQQPHHASGGVAQFPLCSGKDGVAFSTSPLSVTDSDEAWAAEWELHSAQEGVASSAEFALLCLRDVHIRYSSGQGLIPDISATINDDATAAKLALGGFPRTLKVTARMNRVVGAGEKAYTVAQLLALDRQRRRGKGVGLSTVGRRIDPTVNLYCKYVLGHIIDGRLVIELAEVDPDHPDDKQHLGTSLSSSAGSLLNHCVVS